MLSTVWAVMHEGRIELLEPIDLPEGAKLLVTLVEEEESPFWWQDCQSQLDDILNDSDDDTSTPLSEP
jgi:predicted DNA-binding antitoxin AbrB/MazE fold protein